MFRSEDEPVNVHHRHHSAIYIVWEEQNYMYNVGPSICTTEALQIKGTTCK